MRVREACVRLFSLLHRANFVSLSPHLDASCIFSGFLFQCLGLSEHDFLHTLSRWRGKPFFPFFSCLVGACARLWDRKYVLVSRHSSRVSIFACHSHACILAVSRALGRRDRGKSNSYTFWPHRRPACAPVVCMLANFWKVEVGTLEMWFRPRLHEDDVKTKRKVCG